MNEKLGVDEEPRPHGRDVNVFPKAELEGSAPFVPPPVRDADSNRLLSPNDSSPATGSPSTPHPSTPGGFGHSSSGYSPSTPTPGEGTYSSEQSGSHGTSSHTRTSLISPLTPGSASEADSRHLAIYEMAGDMPTIREKDGRSLSEKEALQHRERVYNGVDSAPNSQTALNEPVTPREPPRRVNPGDVVRADTLSHDKDYNPDSRHRAFSFEETRGEGSSDELYE